MAAPLTALSAQTWRRACLTQRTNLEYFLELISNLLGGIEIYITLIILLMSEANSWRTGALEKSAAIKSVLIENISHSNAGFSYYIHDNYFGDLSAL